MVARARCVMYYGQSFAWNGNKAERCMEINQEWHGKHCSVVWMINVNFFLTPTTCPYFVGMCAFYNYSKNSYKACQSIK